jgi:hypothetical protein
LETHPGPLIVPTLVLTEVVYLLGSRLGTRAELQFLGDLASGAFDVEPVHTTDWLRIADLVRSAPSTPPSSRARNDSVSTRSRRSTDATSPSSKANRTFSPLP